jgi:RNA polymerase sigma-70 factor (sigma-E family)
VRADDRRAPRPASGSEDPARWNADTAIGILYPAHWAPLVRLAALLSGDPSVAEEIVQDAFIALHRRWDRLADPAAAPGYLRASVVNGARSAIRHRVVVERSRQPGPPDPVDPADRAVRVAEDAEVLAALRALPQRQREVLVLRYYSDLSEQDIATALGISRGAVKSHAHRGLGTLRRHLATVLDRADPPPESGGGTGPRRGR